MEKIEYITIASGLYFVLLFIQSIFGIDLNATTGFEYTLVILAFSLPLVLMLPLDEMLSNYTGTSTRSGRSGKIIIRETTDTLPTDFEELTISKQSVRVKFITEE